jgi:hypothetical protein
MSNKTGSNTYNLRQLTPLLLDLQAHFLQVSALAENDKINAESLKEIRLLSKHALTMIDYAVFAADYLQEELPLTTISAAAAAKDVALGLKQLSVAYNVKIDLDITKRLEPIYANEAAVKGALYCLAASLITESGMSSLKGAKIIIAAQETAPSTKRLGVYSPDIDLNPAAIKLARSLMGRARAAVPSDMHHSGLGLIVSDQLSQALGSKLQRFVHRDQKGIGFYVSMSQQLSFI